MNVIAILECAGLVAAGVAWLCFWAGRRRQPDKVARGFFALLLLVTIANTTVACLEYGNLRFGLLLDFAEDHLDLLLLISWGLFVFASCHQNQQRVPLSAERTTAHRSHMARIMISACVIVVAGNLIYGAIVLHSIKTTVQNINDYHGPALARLIDYSRGTNNAVQEAFAYVLSGESYEKNDFQEWANNYREDAELFHRVARLDDPSEVDDRQLFEEILAMQGDLVDRAEQMFEDFEAKGSVSQTSFLDFEELVDSLSAKFSELQASEQASYDASQVLANTAMQSAGIELFFLGFVSVVLSVSLLVIVFRSFREHVERQADVQQELAESERRFRQIFDNEPECVKLLTANGHLVDMNAAGLDMIEAESIDQVRGKCVFDIVAPEFRDRFVEATAAVFRGESRTLEFEIVGLQGTRRSMESQKVPLYNASGKVECLLAITRDITEQKHTSFRLQQYRERLAHISRVNTMGEMASSIAHELNQPLAAATNYAFVLEQMADQDRPDLSRMKQHLVDIRKQVLRAGDIVHSLRSLVNKQPSERATVNINSIIRKSLALLEPELQYSQINLRERLSADVSSVSGDKVQIQQVLLNLFRNAIEAMQDVDPTERVLTVATEDTGFEKVAIQVEDSGHGIRNGDQEVVFEAFHSTKPEGMGMGLSISRTIIEAHRGALVVEEAAHRGAIFRITLPLEHEALT